MRSKWMSVIFATFVLAACNAGEAEQGKKKEEIIEPETSVNANSETLDNSKIDLSQMFSEGTYRADVMAIGLSADLNKDAEEITNKMQASLVKNEAWYLETLATLAEGEIFPYDEKLGVTEEEYKFLLELDQHLQLGKVGESEITITQVDEQVIIQNPSSTIIKELTISADESVLQSDFGELIYVEEIIASDAQKITGKWNGHFYQMGGENTEQVLQISMGQLEDNQKKIIYIKLFEEGQEKGEEIFIF
ncbi:MAG: hypothetical protein ACI33M_11240 [Lysinibacillus sp.]